MFFKNKYFTASLPYLTQVERLLGPLEYRSYQKFHKPKNLNSRPFLGWDDKLYIVKTSL